MSKLGAMVKMKSCKVDWIIWEMRAMSFFVLLVHLFLDIASNIITLRTFLTNNPNK